MVIGAPPSDEGGVKATKARPLAGITAAMDGAEGLVAAGVTSAVADAALMP